MELVTRAENARGNRSLKLDGTRCAAARQALGLSRESLAEQSRGTHPLSVATIKRAEQGQPIYLGTASRLAEVLKVPLDVLLGGPSSAEAERARKSSGHMSAIAVLPFKALGAEAAYFSEGLADDLVMRLSRWLFPVIARGSTFTLAGTGSPELGRELGADYVVEGGVLRHQDDIRISVRLLRANNGEVLWANSYQRNLRDLFAAQNTLTAAIVNSIGNGVLEAEVRRYSDCDPLDMTAWDLALLGVWHFHRQQRDDNRTGRELLERAVKLDKRQPLAWYFLALTHQRDLFHQWSEDPRLSLQNMEATTRAFQSTYPREATCHVASAYSDVYQGQRQSAMARLVEAIEIDPNMCAAYSLYGQTLAMSNEPDRALEQFELALRLSPRDSERWAIHLAMGLAHFVAERYDEAIACAERTVAISPNIAFTHGVIASAQAHQGNLAAARAALEAMYRLEPRVSAGGFAAIVKSTNPDIANRYLAGLKLAGLRG